MQQKKKQQKRKRRAYTAADLAELWDRWKRGESSKTIARVMGRGASVYTVLLRCGGIRPRVRCRSPQALTLAEREEISRGIAAGQSLRSIAQRLTRAASTVSREVRRNGGPARYRASEADGRLEADTTPQAVSTGTLSPATPAGRTEAARGLVSATDRWLAEANLSGE